jgi:hypothetical protein
MLIYNKILLLDYQIELILDGTIQMNDKTTLICEQTIQMRYESLLF